MQPLRTDLSIFNRFDLDYPPVGIKFLTSSPEGIDQLDKTMALCEMVKEASSEIDLSLLPLKTRTAPDGRRWV